MKRMKSMLYFIWNYHLGCWREACSDFRLFFTREGFTIPHGLDKKTTHGRDDRRHESRGSDQVRSRDPGLL